MQNRKIPVGVVCLLALLCPGLTRASVQPMMARDALVGTWKATVTSDDGGKDSTDNLTFKGGKFTSETEKGDGFEPATYEDDPAPRAVGAKFSVTLTNKAGDTAKWTGLATGGEMEGTLVITKKDGSTRSYSFKATRK